MDSRPVALVTGSARRLGAAIARGLHAAGYDLALHCHGSQAERDALAAELEAARAGSTLALQADLAGFDRLPELVAATVGRFGRLDALVNNASTFFPTPLGEATPAQWDAVAPGAILWPDAGKPEAAKSAVLARTPLGRTGTPEEVAEAVRWLLADATYTTGQVLRLDGGRMLQD